MWPHRDAVRDRVAKELIQRPCCHGLPGQIAVLGITFQQPLMFQETPDALSGGVRQLGKLSTRRRLHPAKPRARPIGGIDIDTIQKNGYIRVSQLLNYNKYAVS
jgi:hypothetical protein